MRINSYNLNRLFNLSILFLYIYNIAFSFLPLLFRTRIFIGLIGGILSLTKLRTINKLVFNIISLNLLFIFPIFITGIITGNYGLWFLQHAILNIIYLLGGIWITNHIVKSQIRIDDFLYIITCLILLHNLIALSGFIITPLGDLLLKIQKIEEEGGGFKSITVFRSRFLGLGVGSFFTGGIISGLGIIINLYLLKIRYISKLKGTLILILLLSSGLFIARTSIIGLIGLALFINPRSWNKLICVVLYFISFGTVIAVVLLSFLRDTLPIDWAFEIFMNMFHGDKIETSSTNELINMWVLPTKILTWFFGDGIFSNPDGTYYMHTDVGYLRIIYCIGLLGLLVFAINQTYLIISVAKLCKKLKGLVLVFALYIIVLNIKGFAEINFLFYLIIGFLIAQQSYTLKYEAPDKHNITNI